MAFDLDNEELKATRKLHGQYDGLYEDKSDKNVANIEIVIKDCREHLKLYGEAFITANELDRIEHILTEREQDKKRIQELEAENMQKDLEKIGIKEDTEANMKEIIEKFYTANEKCIPKQKVKEILDDIYDYFERLNGPDEDIEYIENKRKELLEE